MGYLVKVVETYRLPNEKDVELFLKELKQDPTFEVSKYSSVKKCKKQKGEIVDEWIRFEVTKVFNEEAAPLDEIQVEYKR